MGARVATRRPRECLAETVPVAGTQYQVLVRSSAPQPGIDDITPVAILKSRGEVTCMRASENETSFAS